MKIEKKTCILFGVTVFLLYLAIHYWPSVASAAVMLIGAASPLIIGCVIAYLINIPMSFFERHYFPKATSGFIKRTRRPVCMFLSVIILFALIVLVIWLVVPELIMCLQLIFSELAFAFEMGVGWLESRNIIPSDFVKMLSDIDWYSSAMQIGQVLMSGLGSVAEIILKVITSVFSGLVTAFLAFIFAIYLLISKEKLGEQTSHVMKRYMKKLTYKRTHHLIEVMDECFHGYIVGQCTEAVILGVLCTVGMWILGLPYATMIGAFIAFTALIPVAGAYIGAGVGVFMIFAVSPVKALIFLIFILVLQQFENNVIFPKVVGTSMGLPGIWVLAAVTLGGGTFGILGMLIGVPLAATAYRLVREDMYKPWKLKKKAEEEAKEENGEETNEA